MILSPVETYNGPMRLILSTYVIANSGFIHLCMGKIGDKRAGETGK